MVQEPSLERTVLHGGIVALMFGYCQSTHDLET